MKKFSILVLSILLVFSEGCHAPQKTKADKKWISLFNGKDINDWMVKIHHHDMNVNFGNTFRAEEGIIKVRYDQYGDFNDQFAHLYYKTPFYSRTSLLLNETNRVIGDGLVAGGKLHESTTSSSANLIIVIE